MIAGKLRHSADVLRSRKALDARGQPTGGEESILVAVPCSLRELSGREFEQAHKIYADATVIVEMYGDPKKPVTAKDVLLVNGNRRLNVGHVNDLQQNGLMLSLLCGEDRK